ncbi:complement C5 isoform X2 [Chanos chanos]|uniref:Complement C5 isoform X2 n=1 Tax=Chanos chanos TaxID=29144 RepID=A0A6J2WSD1_CHACN|nr:complement C5 isoform X2 [Chanos chanos]
MELLFLLSLIHLCWWTNAQDTSYLITYPRVLRLDAAEKVVVQLFGTNQDVTVELSLKKSMSWGDKVYDSQTVTLNAQNKYQSAATLRIFSRTFAKEENFVYISAVSSIFSAHQKVPVVCNNGFLFIQTDKPLYTPEQPVKVRVYSLNEELQPARRRVTLTFSDPDGIQVDMVDLQDVNGIISMDPPFKIPIKPKFGLWKIHAAYTEEFTTTAKAEFEIKEYVLPSISVMIEPEANYISSAYFESFKLKITARYVHGAPVERGDVFVKFGYKTKDGTVMIPDSLKRHLMFDGKLDVTLNIKSALSTMPDGPTELAQLMGSNLHVVVLVQESTGGISQEAELSNMEFVSIPYKLSLIATPPFIKPSLPYTIRVLVRDPLGVPVSRVPVKVSAILQDESGQMEPLYYSGQKAEVTEITQRTGIAQFVYNIPANVKKADFSFVTADTRYSPTTQGQLTLNTEAYKSVNHRYLYIDLPSDQSTLSVDAFASITIYFHYANYLPLKFFSYQVISKGKVVKFSTEKRVENAKSQSINFRVTPDMVPSIRLLVYYILSGEQKAELVADSVWLDVKAKCPNDLKVDLSAPNKKYKPKDTLDLSVKTGDTSLVALSSLDTALYSLRSAKTDPLARVLRHIEEKDLGCGGGGGINNANVFTRAGLAFMTNANAHASDADACTAIVRTKRSVPLEDQRKEKATLRSPARRKKRSTDFHHLFKEKAKTYKSYEKCCMEAFDSLPTLDSCADRARNLRTDHMKCKKAFYDCCKYAHDLRQRDQSVISLSRSAIEFLFDLTPPIARTYFPESWLWEEHSIQDRSHSLVIPRTLPDSLTTWEMKAVGMFNTGICVADPLQVSVGKEISIDVPLPYSMVRGEQLELKGSVYNQYDQSTRFLVTLSVSDGLCLGKGSGQDSPLKISGTIEAGSVSMVSFFIMALTAGEHTLTFTLRTSLGHDEVVKKLRVVPEGVRAEKPEGKTLDPRGVFGTPTRKIELKIALPEKMVPLSSVDRSLTVNGEILGEVLSIITDPAGLQKLVNLPRGSAEVELMALLPIYYVFHFIDSTERWDTLGKEFGASSSELKRKMAEGVTSIMSFKSKREYSFRMWDKDLEASTWLTALVVKTLAEMDKYITINRNVLTNTVNWLITNCQASDGSFKEQSTVKPKKLMGAGADVTEQKVYLTSFVIIAIKNALSVPKSDLEMFADAMKLAAHYVSTKAASLKSLYVKAIAVYAMTLADPHSSPASQLYQELEREASVKGTPAVVRFWKEDDSPQDPLKPNKASSKTVETTVYVLLTALRKGQVSYSKPILHWLTQDQRYGGGFFSTQDSILTLEALTKYGILAKSAKLDMDIQVSYRKKGDLKMIKLTQRHPVGGSIEVNSK